MTNAPAYFYFQSSRLGASSAQYFPGGSAMRHRLLLLVVLAAVSCGEDSAPTTPAPTGPTVGFFVTSVTRPTGNRGGLSVADATCRRLASEAGVASRTWRAYLSAERESSTGQPVNARDRIGAGPWYNVNLVLVANNLTDLHARTGDAAVFLD